MRSVTDYPGIIKRLKEEIGALKAQMGQDLNSSASSAHSHRDLTHAPADILRLKLDLSAQQELNISLHLRLQKYHELRQFYTHHSGFSSARDLKLLTARLKAEITDYKRKTQMIKSGETPFHLRDRKIENEQFTAVQKKTGALERKNEAIRERIRIVENEKTKLEENYTKAVSRMQKEQNFDEKIANLEKQIQAKEQKMTVMRLYHTRNIQENSFSTSPTHQKSKKTQEMLTLKQKELNELRETVKYWESKVASLESGSHRPLGLPTFVEKLKSNCREIDTEIQLLSKLIREKDSELLNYELTAEQVKSDLEKAKAEWRLREITPIQTGSPSPMDRSLVSMRTVSRGKEGKGLGNNVKRCESLSSLQRYKKSPERVIGFATRIVALNRGQFGG